MGANKRRMVKKKVMPLKYLKLGLTLIVIVIAGIFLRRSFIVQKDSCLDDGGCWDQTDKVCRKNETDAQKLCDRDLNGIKHSFFKSQNSNNKIEYFWSKPEGDGPFPLFVLLHPHQEWPDKIGAEVFVKNKSIETWVNKNFITVAISMPGYGSSTGSSDFCGAITQDAVLEVISFLEKQRFVKQNNTFVYGGSRGAVVAALLSTQRNFTAIVLKSGLYDFEQAYNDYGWFNSIKLSMLWELGFNNTESLKKRSAILLADKIKTPILIIHGKTDDRASIQIAERFADKVKLSGGSVKMIELESEHFIPMDKITPYMEDFFKGIIK